MSKEYYVYIHCRESDNTPFYVGKGKGVRACDFNKRNNNHMADKNLYTFVRLSDGLEVTCTRSELCSVYNVLRDNLKKLFNTKNPRKSAGGWKLKETK